MSTTFWSTCVAMLAFAGNSLLARLALSAEAGVPYMDAAGFTGVRLASGALVLAAILASKRRVPQSSGQRPVSRVQKDIPGSWISAGALLVYAVAFSFAYARIGAAIGALILFTSVQATMIGAGLAKGERPRPLEVAGLVIAFGAFAWWIAPHVVTPEIVGALLMIASGIAWGVYSLRGRSALDPVAETAGNFIRTTPIAGLLVVVSLFAHAMTVWGIVIALASGVVASALGYIVWYSALPRLTATRAAIVQLSVPVIAAMGAIAFLDEELTTRFVVASVAILGGIAIAVSSKARSPKPAIAARLPAGDSR